MAASGLRSYIIRRLLLLVPVLLGATLLIFAVSQMFSPVERASLYVRDPKQLRNIDEIIKKYHLDDPFFIQFSHWLAEVLKGNLGWSKSVNMPVARAIVEFLPATAELVLYAAPLIIFLGIKMGVLSATHRDTPLDHATRTLAIIGWSLPSFWLGIVLLAVFYGVFGLFPPGRLSVEASIYVNSPNFIRYTKLNTIDALLNGQFWIFVDALKHLVLPVATLVIINIALLMRITRSSMLEEMSKLYVMMARAKGLDDKVVVNKHVQRNALISALTVSGLLTASLLCGVVITETVFNYHGIGYWAVHAAIQLDIPAVLGFTLFSALIFVAANLIVDIMYAYVDPRIKLG